MASKWKHHTGDVVKAVTYAWLTDRGLLTLRRID